MTTLCCETRSLCIWKIGLLVLTLPVLSFGVIYYNYRNSLKAPLQKPIPSFESTRTCLRKRFAKLQPLQVWRNLNRHVSQCSSQHSVTIGRYYQSNLEVNHIGANCKALNCSVVSYGKWPSQILPKSLATKGAECQVFDAHSIYLEKLRSEPMERNAEGERCSVCLKPDRTSNSSSAESRAHDRESYANRTADFKIRKLELSTNVMVDFKTFLLEYVQDNLVYQLLVNVLNGLDILSMLLDESEIASIICQINIVLYSRDGDDLEKFTFQLKKMLNNTTLLPLHAESLPENNFARLFLVNTAPECTMLFTYEGRTATSFCSPVDDVVYNIIQ